MEMDEDEHQAQGGNIGGSEGGVESSGAQAVPLKEEGYDPPLTRNYIEVASSGYNEAHFYQYMDEHFSRLNLRLYQLMSINRNTLKISKSCSADKWSSIAGNKTYSSTRPWLALPST